MRIEDAFEIADEVSDWFHQRDINPKDASAVLIMAIGIFIGTIATSEDSLDEGIKHAQNMFAAVARRTYRQQMSKH